jgi:hypothetical protein
VISVHDAASVAELAALGRPGRIMLAVDVSRWLRPDAARIDKV